MKRFVITALVAFQCVMIALTGAGAADPHAADNSDPLAGRFGGPFRLETHDGRTVTEADFRGRFMLIYFGYTNCPDICPMDTSALGRALDLLGPAASKVQPLFITVDPARDTAPVLARYVKSIHPALIGLTGSEASISAVAKAYKVHRRKLESPTDGGPANYTVDHGSLTYLMGPDGGFRTLLPHMTSSERMAEIIAGYLRANEAADGARAP